MSRNGEKIIPWAVGVLPLAAAMATAVSIDPNLLAGDVTVLRDQQLLVLGGAALSGSGLAYWTAAVLRRYREKIGVREQALRAFNASVDTKVAEEVDKQRRRDKVIVQHAKMRAMADVTELIRQQWLPSSDTMRALPAATETAGKTTEEVMQTLSALTELFRPDTAREPVDLSESIEQVLTLLKEDLAAHDISVQMQLECSMTLPLHRNEILQVLIGVVKNARDALVARAVELPRIDIECYETGQFIVIRICDNAGGVEANEADRIFEPYFTTKAHTDAAGLDLYLARSTIEEHCSGELTFDNFDEGACFYIKIGKHQEDEAS